MSDLAFPLHFDRRGRSADSSPEDHIRDLIEQALLTTPGERVMRPDFGSGLLGLVFEPNSTALAATTQMLVQGALHQHLGHLISVDEVSIETVDSLLQVSVRYVVRRDQSTRQATFTVPGGA